MALWELSVWNCVCLQKDMYIAQKMKMKELCCFLLANLGSPGCDEFNPFVLRVLNIKCYKGTGNDTLDE